MDGAIDVYGSMEDLAVREGRYYSEKAPGLSFASAPVVLTLGALLPPSEAPPYPDYWPLRNVLTWAIVVLPGALFPFLLLRRCPGAAGPEQRLPLALLLALATPLLTYSTVFFGHAPAGILAAAAWVVALRPGASDVSPSPLAAAGAGFLAALAVSFEYPAAIVGCVILGSLAARRSGLLVLAAFAGGAAAGLIPLLAYHAAAFGHPWSTGYAFQLEKRYAEVHAVGLMGVALPTFESLWGVLGSARRGILFYCPLLLLVPAGLLVMARRARRDAVPLLLAACGYLAVAAGFQDWRGGWSAAARHLVAAVPLALIPLAGAVGTLSRTARGAFLVAVLAGVSVGNGLLSLIVSPFFPVTFRAPLAQAALTSFLEGAAFPNLLTATASIPAPEAALLWGTFVVLAAAAAVHRLSPPSRWRPWVPIVLVSSLFLSVSIQWALRPENTPLEERIRAYMLQRLGLYEHAVEIWRAHAE